jgi:ABC-type transport system involved in cytochrome c biogenesis ATPase subunit
MLSRPRASCSFCRRPHGLRRGESAHRAELLLATVDLADAADKRLGEFSGGLQRRGDLAAALMHLPAVLFLDEPLRTVTQGDRGLHARLERFVVGAAGGGVGVGSCWWPSASITSSWGPRVAPAPRSSASSRPVDCRCGR